MNRIAFIGHDRQLHVVSPDGEWSRQLTSALPRSGGPWAMLGRTQEVWSWPTWAPNGTEIAAFCTESSDEQAGPVRLISTSLDGIRQEEWASIPDGTPLYLQWHPQGEVLSLLMQRNNELVLAVVHRDRPGQVRLVETGVPLFYSWQPDGNEMLVHVGGRKPGVGRLIRRDPLGDGEDHLFDVEPGNFCAPLFQAGMAVYARRAEEGSELVASNLEGTEAKVLATRRGLLAVVGAPGNAPRVALSAASSGEGSPYQGLDRVDLQTGEVVRLSDTPCFAFFWSPTGDFLVYVQIDMENNCLQWYQVAATGGEPVALGSFWPTRDLLFYLHFFDQYAASHPNISADGRYLVYAGYPAGNGQADLSGLPLIFVQDLQSPGTPPREVGNGSFAVFGPN